MDSAVKPYLAAVYDFFAVFLLPNQGLMADFRMRRPVGTRPSVFERQERPQTYVSQRVKVVCPISVQARGISLCEISPYPTGGCATKDGFASPDLVAAGDWKIVAVGQPGYCGRHGLTRALEFNGYLSLNWIRTGLWSDPDDSVVPSITEYDFGT